MTDTEKQNSTGNTDKRTHYKSEKSKQPKIQQNKTTLVQLLLTALGQETRWAYSITLPSPHRATGMERGWGNEMEQAVIELVQLQTMKHTGINRE